MRAAHRLYFRLPIPLQNLAISLYGLRLRRARYGAYHDQVRQQLAESERFGSDRLAELQLTLLRRTVATACTVPLYRRIGIRDFTIDSLESLSRLPRISKADLQRPMQDLVAEAFGGRRLDEIHTGGTTGKPLVVYCDRRTLQTNYAFFTRFRSWAGIAPGERTAVFAGRLVVPSDQSRPPYWRRNLASRALLLSSYHLSPETIPSYVRALRDFAPALIDSYPSSIDPIARHILESGAPSVRPRAIITSSETLTAGTRSRLEGAFGCRVFDYYGSAEMVALITQCEHDTYHVNPEFGMVEILTPEGRTCEPGQMGEIVATGFINHVMPLIRYRTGDLAVAGSGRCECGRAFPVIEQIVGRLDDVVVTPDGRRVGRLDPIFKATQGIMETRIVQDRTDRVVLEIVRAPSFRPIDEESLVDELRHRLGPTMHIEVRHVEAIARAGSGKLRTVVNLVDTTAGARVSGSW